MSLNPSHKKKSKKDRLSNKKSDQTISDYWNSHPAHYFTRQSIMLASEIAFLACASYFYVKDVGKECRNEDEVDVYYEYNKAMILVLICHVYQILKAAYYAWAHKR